jgi:hypothetical protein
MSMNGNFVDIRAPLVITFADVNAQMHDSGIITTKAYPRGLHGIPERAVTS